MESIIAPVRWGILGAARIADGTIIPAMSRSAACNPEAIASRNFDRAKAMADAHGIPNVYEDFDQLLADTNIEAVYIALPNHLHVEWTLKAAKAGKHVLCEKPAAMSLGEARTLIGLDPHLKVSEAFMVRHQPRWLKLKEILQSGAYGAPRSVSTLLSFMITKGNDFRHRPEFGGGAYFDLGCYTAMTARYAFGEEPKRVFAAMERNTNGIDLFTSVVLDFGNGRHATFMVSLAQASSQTLEIVCDGAFIVMPQAYVPLAGKPSSIIIDTSVSHAHSDPASLEFPPLDQYEEEVTNFARAVRGEEVPFYGINDIIANAAITDAVFASAQTGSWVSIGEK